MTRWMLWLRDDAPSIVIAVVDDSGDDELAAIIAREDHVPSPNFGGLWGSGQEDGHWLVAFHLIQLGGGVERQWFTSNIHRPLLEAVLDVPHLVAIVPEEIAGDANSAEEMAPRFGGALILEVDSPSPQVAEILAERGED
ncbi:MAG TPA: hypothetical protein VIS51_08010 [Solirubrobacterales bacterium]